MMYLYTKFDVSMFTHYEDMKGNANVEFGVVWGLGMTQSHRHWHHSTERLWLLIRL